MSARVRFVLTVEVPDEFAGVFEVDGNGEPRPIEHMLEESLDERMKDLVLDATERELNDAEIDATLDAVNVTLVRVAE